MYVRAEQWDLADNLARRVNPELEEYVKRARINNALSKGGAGQGDSLESIDQDAAIKAHIASNEWDKVMRLARTRGAEDARMYAAMQVQYLLRENQVEKALDVISRDGMETKDFRFFDTWTALAEVIVKQLPSFGPDLSVFHLGFQEVVGSMRKTAQPDQAIAKADALLQVLHI